MNERMNECKYIERLQYRHSAVCLTIYYLQEASLSRLTAQAYVTLDSCCGCFWPKRQGGGLEAAEGRRTWPRSDTQWGSEHDAWDGRTFRDKLATLTVYFWVTWSK